MELSQGFPPHRRALAGGIERSGAVQRNHNKSRNFVEIQAVSQPTPLSRVLEPKM